jgi:hypothetical protein
MLMRRLFLVAVAGGCCLLSAPVTAAEDCRHPGSFHRGFVWQGGQLSGRALFLFECAPNGLNSRLLLETPSGAKVTITETDDVRRGRKTTRLVDDDSGWWLEIARDSHFKAQDLGDFFRRVYDELKPGHPLGFHLSTRDGLAFRTRGSYRAHPDPEHKDLARGLRAAGLADKLLETVPPSVVDAVRFLAAVRSDDSQQVSFLPAPTAVFHELLPGEAGPSRNGAPYSKLRWQEEAAPLRKGLVVSDPELLEFVVGFTTVSTPDPLSDHRLETVVPPVADSPHR